MDFMSTLIQISVLFILIVVGFTVGRAGLVSPGGRKELTSVLMYVALPSSIIKAMQIDFDSDKFAVAIGILLTMLILYIAIGGLSFVLIKLFRAEGKQRDVYQLAMILPNVGFMGYPVVEAVFGSEAIFYAAVGNMPFELISWTLGMYIISRNGDTVSNDNPVKKSIINPGVISVIVGMTLFLTSTHIPDPFATALGMTAGLTSPLAMMLIGITLSTTNILSTFKNLRLYLLGFIKLVLLPVCVMMVMQIIGMKGMGAVLPALLISMPSASYTAIFSSKAGSDDRLASEAVFMCTLLSMLTIPVIASLLTA